MLYILSLLFIILKGLAFVVQKQSNQDFWVSVKTKASHVFNNLLSMVRRSGHIPQDEGTVLKNNIAFFNEKALGEHILKQSLIKGTFPRLSYRRDLIQKEMNTIIDPRIHIDMPKVKSDFRLIGEVLTADALIKSSNSIEKIIMNFEDPKRIKLLTNHGNVNKDVTLHLNVNNHSFLLERDIKAGNNADNPFSGILAAIPYSETFENYSVINQKPISLPNLQKLRIQELRKIRAESNMISENIAKIEYINVLPINIIQKNILIQEEIFHIISQGISLGSPSFYAAYIIPHQPLLHAKLFEGLEPYITTELFNNKATFKIYMAQALKIYNECVTEIAKNAKLNKKLLKESRLNEITDDIFN